MYHADVAQLVERDLAKVEVAGSSPVVRSKDRSWPSSVQMESPFLSPGLPGSTSAASRSNYRGWPMHQRRGRSTSGLVLSVLVVAVTQIIDTPAGLAGTKTTSVFDEPVAIAASGGYVWVANVGGNSVTELNAASGKMVRVVDANADGITTPVALTVTGTNVWIVNDGVRGSRTGTGSLTELSAANGSLVSVVSDQLDNPSAATANGSNIWITNQHRSANDGSVTVLSSSSGAVSRNLHSASDDFDGPVAIVARGDDVWVASSGGNNAEGSGKDQGSVTELNSLTGAVVRVIGTNAAQFDVPTAMVLSGPDLWVANLYFSSIVELNAATGTLVRFITSTSLNQPVSLAVCGSDVWAANYFGSTVTEFSRSSGKVVRVIGSWFKQPGGIACSSGHVWVTNGPSDSVTELNASDGSLVRIIK